LIASIGISQVVDKSGKDETPEVKLAPVYVAALDVPSHQKLNAQSVKLEEWPIDRIPPGAVTKFEDLDGRKPAQPLYTGEVILSAKIIDSTQRALKSERIPKGYRVVSVDVNMSSAVSGLLSPGDRVDVLGFFKGRGRAPVTKTVLTDISVFAINDKISRATGDEDAGSIKAKTVSLTVKPAQAQRLLLAAELGQIKLSLRNNNDDSVETPDGSDPDDLNPQGLAGILSGLKLPPTIPVAAIDNSPKFTMEVVSPASMNLFSWTDRNALPEIVKRTETASVGGNTNRDLIGGGPEGGGLEATGTSDDAPQSGNPIDAIKMRQDELWSEFQEAQEAEQKRIEKAKDEIMNLGIGNGKTKTIGPFDSAFGK
jgi:pilus assembly protein CpaB